MREIRAGSGDRAHVWVKGEMVGGATDGHTGIEARPDTTSPPWSTENPVCGGTIWLSQYTLTSVDGMMSNFPK